MKPKKLNDNMKAKLQAQSLEGLVTALLKARASKESATNSFIKEAHDSLIEMIETEILEREDANE